MSCGVYTLPSDSHICDRSLVLTSSRQIADSSIHLAKYPANPWDVVRSRSTCQAMGAFSVYQFPLLSKSWAFRGNVNIANNFQRFISPNQASAKWDQPSAMWYGQTTGLDPSCSVNGTDPQKQLAVIAQLSDDWNGYGASAFSAEIINRVRKVISAIMDAGLTPQVFPTAADSIQLEFDNEDCYLEFEIYEDGTIQAYMEKGNEVKEGFINESDLSFWLKDFSC